MADPSSPAAQKRRRVTLTHAPVSSELSSPLLVELPVGASQLEGLHSFNQTRGSSRKPRRYLASDVGRVQFEASNFGENARRTGSRYAIGIFDKASGTVQVVEVPVFGASMKIHALDKLQVQDHDTPITSGKDLADRRNDLGETFGARKLVSQIRTQERNKVNVDMLRSSASAITETLDARVGAMAADLPDPDAPEADPMAAVSEDSPLPPFDRLAATPEDVYRLDVLIPPAEEAGINIALLRDAVKGGPSEIERVVKEHELCNFVARHLRIQHAAVTASQPVLRMLAYMTALVRLLRSPKSVIQNENKLTYLFEDVMTADGAARCVSKFANAAAAGGSKAAAEPDADEGASPTLAIKGRVLSSFARDLLVSYILALCLHLENFALDPALIAPDLLLDRKKIATYLRNMGCTTSQRRTRTFSDASAGSGDFVDEEDDDSKADLTATNSTDKPTANVYVLRVPLTFPRLSRGRAARR
ncbi:hypothetical protein H696_01900, partial [Fonticula alba]